ncbi:hypothetical protein E2C01_032898 [Portunus trituberculatus]|uniref:Uncharacterized protein n=1 Tax=Portunus trituberculatus TaxID=210409 RepID=A0A5B7F2Q2_PORTR|nr:hypothetical protein [Portunus trituberculatus]
MKPGDRRGRLTAAVQIAAIAVAGGLFINQLRLQVASFLNHPITTTVTLRLLSSLLPPPIVVCPQHPFDLEVLRDFGMKFNDTILMKNLSNLQYLDPEEDAQQVWEKAAYRLGQVVHSFTFGHLEENYTMDTLSSAYWRRVTSPLGSCFALFLPHVNISDQRLPSLTITLRTRPVVSSCPLSPYDCSESLVTQRCNSSCDFERFLEFNNKIGSYFIMVGKMYNEKSQHQHDKLGRQISYLLSKEAWQTASLGVTSEPLNLIEISSTLMENIPLVCDSTSKKVSASDFDMCVDSYFWAKNHCVLVRPDSNITLKEACKIGVMHEAITKELHDKIKCSGPLTGRCHRIQWTHEVRNSLDISKFTSKVSQVRLNFTSPKVRVETEIDMYPFSQLASDFGGSLGLFLGMSILTMWQCVDVKSRQLLPESNWGRQFNRLHCKHLLYWIVIASLAFFTVVHSFLALQNYIIQPIRVSVKRANTPDVSLLIHQDHLSDHVAARLASRSLDCRPGPQTKDEECMLKCLMWQTLKQVSGVAPFVEVDDLPICPAKHTWTYSITYIVPSLSYATATDAHLVRQCRQKCGGVTMRPLRGLKVNHQYFSITINDLLCSFGGIVSLYAGLFLTSTVDLLIRLIPTTNHKTCVLHTIAKVVLNSVIYVSGAVIATFLLYRFIFDHPVSSGEGGSGLTLFKQPMLTVCHWPPFESNIVSNSSLPVDEEWAASAWGTRVSRVSISRGLGHLMKKEKNYNLTSVVTMFNRCDSLAARVVYKNLIVSLFYWWDPEDSVVVGVHDTRDPAFVSHIDNVKLLEVLNLNVVTASYRRLSHSPVDKDTLTYDTCLYRCIHDKHDDYLGCRLPFTTWRSDLPLCSPDTARHHTFWPGDAPPKRPLKMRKDSSQCHATCRKYKTEIILMQSEKKNWLESGVNIMQLPKNSVDLREQDWYSFLQLANDLGVVAGFTFGASVLSILQKALLSSLPRL